jgi:hypothetical protein
MTCLLDAHQSHQAAVLTVLPPLLLTLLPAHVHARLLLPLLLLLLLLWQLLVGGCAAAPAATYSSHSAVVAAAAAGCCWLLCPAHWALRLLLSCAAAQRSCALPLLQTPWLPWHVL